MCKQEKSGGHGVRGESGWQIYVVGACLLNFSNDRAKSSGVSSGGAPKLGRGR